MSACLRRAARFFVLLSIASVSPLAAAWNSAGHRLVAAIAWDELGMAERTALAVLLDAHPDVDRWHKRVLAGEDPARVAFVEASTWADDIRRDPRFHDEGVEPETSLLPGFPDMARRRAWHYLNLPVDGAGASSGGELDSRLKRLGETLADPAAGAARRAYALVWLIHLVGDIHQPLHVATRRTGSGEDDAGGNGVAVSDPRHPRRTETNLHAWWDDLPGPPWLRGKRLLASAQRLRSALVDDEASATLDPGRWRDESHGLAARSVYAPVTGVPFVIDEAYRATARRIADERVARAGVRLARLLAALLARERR